MIHNNQQAAINNTTQEEIVNDSSTSSSFNLQVNATDGKAKINMESNINTDTDTNINKRKVEQKNKFTERSKRPDNLLSLLNKIRKTENSISLELDDPFEQLSDMITEQEQSLNDYITELCDNDEYAADTNIIKINSTNVEKDDPNTSDDDKNPTTILDLAEKCRNMVTDLELLDKKMEDTFELARQKGFLPLEQKAEDPTVEQRA